MATRTMVTLVICACAYARADQSATRRIGMSATNGCPTPSLTLNGSAVVARRNATPDYSTLSEIKFTARMPLPFAVAKSQSQPQAQSQHRVCKIKCVAGEWVGPLCKIEQNNEDDGRFHPILRSCSLHLNGTNLALVYEGALLKHWNGRIPDRSKITILCDGEPGLYKMNASPHLQCLDGDWNRELPQCLPTTSISAYSENSPPTIRIKLAFGDSVIDYRHNRVVIYPGSIVHLECLFRRNYGDVRWTWTTTTTTTTSAQAAQPLQQQRNRLTVCYKMGDSSLGNLQLPKYLPEPFAKCRLAVGPYTWHAFTYLPYVRIFVRVKCCSCRGSNNYELGWSIAADEREWIYRMSLYYVKTEQDSGNYTCITPKRQNNTITLKVEAVQCEKRNENEKKRNVISISTSKTPGNHVGQTIEYACPVGFTLVGSNQSSCLADGNWSSAVPYCEPIVCVSVTIADVQLIASGSNNTYGSTIGFRCTRGYALKGANEIRCEIDGQWSSSIPKCVDILCAPPSIPANGYLLEKSNGPNYRAGTIVQFACEKPYRLVGEESIICEDNSMWSNASPRCRIVCEYPGEPANGRLVPSKLWYETGDSLRVVCDVGYVKHESESILVSCSKNGTWSTKIPVCVNLTQI